MLDATRELASDEAADEAFPTHSHRVDAAPVIDWISRSPDANVMLPGGLGRPRARKNAPAAWQEWIRDLARVTPERMVVGDCVFGTTFNFSTFWDGVHPRFNYRWVGAGGGPFHPPAAGRPRPVMGGAVAPSGR